MPRLSRTALGLAAVAAVAAALVHVGVPGTAARSRTAPLVREAAAFGPLALVFRSDHGEAGCAAEPGVPGCAEALAGMLEHAPEHFQVRYVGPDGDPLTPGLLREAALYAQPGGRGDLARAWQELRPYAAMIQDYVRGGGHYLGSCMGGYLARAVHDDGSGGFRLLPGDVAEFITDPAAPITDTRAAAATVSWRGRSRAMYFQDGPSFPLDGSPGAEVLARYPTTTGAAGPPAVVVTRYGAGRVAVTGPHPEAPDSWWRQISPPVTPPAGLNADLAADLLTDLMAPRDDPPH